MTKTFFENSPPYGKLFKSGFVDKDAIRPNPWVFEIKKSAVK